MGAIWWLCNIDRVPISVEVEETEDEALPGRKLLSSMMIYMPWGVSLGFPGETASMKWASSQDK